MPRHLDTSAQIPLFALHPEGAEPPVAQRVITPGCLLPAAPNQFIDVRRAGVILGLTDNAVVNLIRLGHIGGVQLSRSSSFRHNIPYASVVDFCDRLRVQFAIRDRRPKLAPGRRWRDADLLPFPLADTVAVKDLMTGLQIAKHPALRLIEEGVFEAYRLTPGAPWRISKSSLYAYAEALKRQMNR